MEFTSMPFSDEDNRGFKSKNLDAERRRREKLNNRLLELRSVVPVITNMKKETAITDAIDYIRNQQQCVEDLSQQLHEMEATIEDEIKSEVYEIDTAKQMQECGIQAEVNVTQIDANKVWIKLIFNKKRGRFSKLMEATSVLGLDFSDISVNSIKGAVLVNSCVETIHGGMLQADQIHDLLAEIISGL